MLLPIGFLVDLIVHVDHNHSWDPERHTGADHTIDSVHHKDADIGIMRAEHLMLMRRVPAEEYGKERHQRWWQPHDAEHDEEARFRHDQVVVKRLNNSVVTINTDATQVENARRTEVNVEAVPDIAHEVPKQPSVEDLNAQVETHGSERDEHVCEGQRHDEVVRDHSELPVTHDRHDHQKVPEDGAQDDEQHEEDFQSYQQTDDETSLIVIVKGEVYFAVVDKDGVIVAFTDQIVEHGTVCVEKDGYVASDAHIVNIVNVRV